MMCVRLWILVNYVQKLLLGGMNEGIVLHVQLYEIELGRVVESGWQKGF